MLLMGGAADNLLRLSTQSKATNNFLTYLNDFIVLQIVKEIKKAKSVLAFFFSLTGILLRGE